MIRLLAAVMLLALLPALAAAAEFGVVKGGRLNLRQYANATSASLGKYATGTWVELIQLQSNGWWQVRTLDGKSGFMSGNYIERGASASDGTVKYANGGYVNLRSGPSLNYSVLMRVTSGSQVTILSDTNEWNYISVNNGYGVTNGYMHDSFISRAVTTATVTTRNGGKVNLRSGPSSSYPSIGTLPSGTKVTVLNKGNDWYKVSANGMVGYMSTGYLSGTGSTLGSNTGTTTSSRVAYVNNPRSTQVLNLRESASQSARSIGQYRNGTQVKVVSYGSTWCEVYVGTKHGYMMTRYLSFDGNYVQPSYTQAPIYVYVTPTPTPYYVQYATPTPLVQYITPQPQQGSSVQPPKAGTTAWLAVAAGGNGSTVTVYNDPSLTSPKATYNAGQRITILQYSKSVCMVLVDSGVAYVSTWNVNY